MPKYGFNCRKIGSEVFFFIGSECTHNFFFLQEIHLSHTRTFFFLSNINQNYQTYFAIWQIIKRNYYLLPLPPSFLLQIESVYVQNEIVQQKLKKRNCLVAITQNIHQIDECSTSFKTSSYTTNDV